MPKAEQEKFFATWLMPWQKKVMRFLPYVSMKIKDSQGSN